MKSHRYSFPSCDTSCKFLEGRDQGILTWHCSEPKDNHERLRELGKGSRGPGLIRVGQSFMQMDLGAPEKVQYW